MGSSTPSQRRQLVAVWFADIVGFSDLASANEDDAVRLVDAFQACASEHVQRQGGRIVKYVGDAALAEFHSTEQAAHSACDLVQDFVTRFGAQLRVGLHVADVAVGKDEDLLGDGVNLAVRLQAEADPGEVVVSEDAWRQLRQREGFTWEEIGERRVRGQVEPVRLFRVRLAEEPVVPSEPRPPDALDRARRGFRRRGGSRLRLPDARRMTVGIATAVLIGVAGLAIRARSDGWLAALGGYGGSSDPSADSLADIPSYDPTRIAVLYFDDYSDDQSLGYMASAATEALINSLDDVEGLTVVPEVAVKPFRHSDIPLDSIIFALKVGTVIDGNLTRSGDRIRVTAQLIDGNSGEQLGSGRLDYVGTDVLELQEKVVDLLGRVLRSQLGREIRMREIERSTDSPRAYEALMRAESYREEYQRLRRWDDEAARRALHRADTMVARAESLDPRWAEPVIRRAWYLRDLSILEGPLPGYLDDYWSGQALTHAERAVALDGAAAYEIRGLLRFGLAMNATGEERQRLFSQAEADLREATALDESRTVAWVKLSELLVSQGRFSEAVLASERGSRADAFLSNNVDALHQAYYSALQIGATEEANDLCLQGRVRFPTSADFVLCRLFALASFPEVEPDLAHAQALVDTLAQLVPQDDQSVFRAYGIMLSAEVAARAGLRDSAEALIRQSRSVNDFPMLSYNEAHARLLLGEQQEAVQLLEKWLEVDPDTAYLAGDWWFEGLHDNSRFRALLGRHDPRLIPGSRPR
ncbi:MAG TPA: adenylate/guanylate cyclase domain-containing protein [Longimicrobiaceae bacterium]